MSNYYGNNNDDEYNDCPNGMCIPARRRGLTGVNYNPQGMIEGSQEIREYSGGAEYKFNVIEGADVIGMLFGVLCAIGALVCIVIGLSDHSWWWGAAILGVLFFLFVGNGRQQVVPKVTVLNNNSPRYQDDPNAIDNRYSYGYEDNTYDGYHEVYNEPVQEYFAPSESSYGDNHSYDTGFDGIEIDLSSETNWLEQAYNYNNDEDNY